MADSPQSLSSLFRVARTKEAELRHFETSSNEYQESLQAAVSILEECQGLIERSATFSSNETSEDIATSSIPFLGVDYLLAELLLKTYGTNRIRLLQQSAFLLESFLTRLEAYDLLSRHNKQLLDQYQENKETFQLAAINDAAERRRIKVARFQEEKGLKNKLELLKAQSGQSTVDDEILRRLYFTELDLFAGQSFQNLDIIVQERSILSQVPSEARNALLATSDPRQGDQRIVDDYVERLDAPKSGLGQRGPLLSKEGKPLQPFTITSKRNQLRQGVFRSGHNLPTMTIEDYLEEEKRRGGIIQGGEDSGMRAAQPDEDNIELADQETMKARAWDEYTEANAKGSGNTLNRG